MSRAALLPLPGDPFLFAYWLSFFDLVWGNEVDTLYVYLNTPTEAAVVNYIRDLCNARPKINLQYLSYYSDHGPAINRMLDIVTEDNVMLIEDDGFIFRQTMVDKCFRYLESGQAQIVGSARGSCHPEILEAAQRKWGIPYEGEGDRGPNFWPNFFFSSKALLLRTDRNFAAKAWKQGEVIEPLGYTVKAPVIHGDTFVNTSLQLRAMVPQEQIVMVPQYHGSPEDLEHARKHIYLFDGMAPWTHAGSLSSGVSGILRDSYNRPLAKREIMPAEEKTELPLSWCDGEGPKKEMERRMQFFLTAWEAAPVTYHIAEFHSLYGHAIQQVIEQYKLDRGNINMRRRVYRTQLGI
jgi:hypothetical protein